VDAGRGARPRWRERVASVRDEAFRFSGGHPGRLWRVFALDLVFHALAVLEVFLTLRWVLGDRSPTLVQAIVFEALNRVITAAFKFVPFRVGIDEASAGALAPILSVNPAAGRGACRREKGKELVLGGDRPRPRRRFIRRKPRR
jgi:hypothetical protein